MLPLEWGPVLPPELAPPFDVVLCSDLLYDPACWDALLASLAALSSGPETAILLAHRCRNTLEMGFFAALAASGLAYERLDDPPRDVLQTGREGGGAAQPPFFSDIALYKLVRTRQE